MIEYTCPKCSADLSSPEQMAGRAASCPTCGEHLFVPAVSQHQRIHAGATVVDSEPRRRQTGQVWASHVDTGSEATPPPDPTVELADQLADDEVGLYMPAARHASGLYRAAAERDSSGTLALGLIVAGLAAAVIVGSMLLYLRRPVAPAVEAGAEPSIVYEYGRGQPPRAVGPMQTLGVAVSFHGLEDTPRGPMLSMTLVNNTGRTIATARGAVMIYSRDETPVAGLALERTEPWRPGEPWRVQRVWQVGPEAVGRLRDAPSRLAFRYMARAVRYAGE